MLVGPSRPAYPKLPTEAEGLRGIVHYLRDLQRFSNDNISTVVATTIGMLGVRGFSATGVPANNFTRGFLDIGNQSSAVWTLTAEANTTYLIFAQPSSTASVAITGVTKGVTSVTFSFSGQVPTGIFLDCLLLR